MDLDEYKRTRYVLRRKDTYNFVSFDGEKQKEVEEIFDATLFRSQADAKYKGSRYFHYNEDWKPMSKEEWHRQRKSAQNPQSKPFLGVAINRFDKETYEVLKIILPKGRGDGHE
jgi:hypothetical protein